MKFANLNENNTYINNPKGYRSPYRITSQHEEERFKWRYFRLSNYPSRPNKVRCNSHLFGDCERRNPYLLF